MFDDRLATVLRTRMDSAAGAATKYRQLVDLLGSSPPVFDGRPLRALALRAAQLSASDRQRMVFDPALRMHDQRLLIIAAFTELACLTQSIAAEDQARILREAGLRLRNSQLVEFFAHAQPRLAASVMAMARLGEADWKALIPRLPVTARGFLRHRRDLPAGAVALLQRLGVGDLVLPDCSPGEPQPAPSRPVAQPAPPEPVTRRASPRQTPPAGDAQPSRERDGIGSIIERIEQFREARRAPVLAPRLPLGDAVSARGDGKLESLDLRTDCKGRVIAAASSVAPWLTGMLLTGAEPGPLALFSQGLATAFRHRQPVRNAAITISAAPQVSGEWRIDATPVFETASGDFAGYRCRLRRPPPLEEVAPATDSAADRMRQTLHELRTPVGAIQGFAEIIQQQLFGPAPHEYRAHAAAISVDAARLLAGFDEVERLARLESGAARLDPGEADLRDVVHDTLRRLDGVLRARDAGFDLEVSGSPFTLGIARTETLSLCWRVFATLAGGLAPAERVALKLAGSASHVEILAELPASLRGTQGGQGRRATARPVVSAGMFGPDFALRLAAAEARASGGEFIIEENRLRIRLPVLTPQGSAHSSAGETIGG